MSVKDTKKIDGMGIEEATNTLVFLITDPFPWNVQEYQHLKAIQTKINNYVGYIEHQDYRTAYGSRKFSRFRIETALKFAPTKNGRAFFEAGKKQLEERNIDFVYTVVDQNKKENASE